MSGAGISFVGRNAGSGNEKSRRRPLQSVRMIYGGSVTTHANKPIILGRVNPWQPLVGRLTLILNNRVIKSLQSDGFVVAPNLRSQDRVPSVAKLTRSPALI